MPKISAPIAAALCTMVLSAEAYGAGRGPVAAANPPSWLAFRAAFAAEDLWQQPQSKVKPGGSEKSSYAMQQTATTSLAAENSLLFQQALATLRSWGRAAERILDQDRTSFEIAGN